MAERTLSRTASVDDSPFEVSKKKVSTLLRENPYVFGVACVSLHLASKMDYANSIIVCIPWWIPLWL